MTVYSNPEVVQETRTEIRIVLLIGSCVMRWCGGAGSWNPNSQCSIYMSGSITGLLGPLCRSACRRPSKEAPVQRQHEPRGLHCFYVFLCMSLMLAQLCLLQQLCNCVNVQHAERTKPFSLTLVLWALSQCFPPCGRLEGYKLNIGKL